MLLKCFFLIWATQAIFLHKIDPASVAELVARHRQAAIERWETDIRKLENLNREQALPEDGILFVGSSSIRRWESLAEDMAPWPTIRRGYGGAKFTDLAVFIDRLTRPIEFRALVIFVANDISGKPNDRSPQEVAGLFQYVVARVREHHPAQPIFYVAVTPTSSRFSSWEEISRGNALIAELCESDSSLHFITTADAYLNAQGRPRDELFVDDKLHLNAAGYEKWASIIKQKLEEVLGTP